MTKNQSIDELKATIKAQRKQLLRAKRLLTQAIDFIPDYTDFRNDKMVDKIYKFLEDNNG